MELKQRKSISKLGEPLLDLYKEYYAPEELVRELEEVQLALVDYMKHHEEIGDQLQPRYYVLQALKHFFKKQSSLYKKLKEEESEEGNSYYTS